MRSMTKAYLRTTSWPRQEEAVYLNPDGDEVELCVSGSGRSEVAFKVGKLVEPE